MEKELKKLYIAVLEKYILVEIHPSLDKSLFWFLTRPHQDIIAVLPTEREFNAYRYNKNHL